MTTLDGIEFEIIKLELKAGDTVLFKAKYLLSPTQARELQEKAQRNVPDGVKVMVIMDELLSVEVTKAG